MADASLPHSSPSGPSPSSEMNIADVPSGTSLELSQALTNLRTDEQPEESTDEVADSSSITSESTLFTDSDASGELSLGPERDFAELHSLIHSIVYAQGSSDAPRLYDSLKEILQGLRVVFRGSRPVVGRVREDVANESH